MIGYARAPRRLSFIAFLVSSYTILISLWFLSWLTVGDAVWWLALLNRAVPYLFLPIPFLLLFVLFSAQYRVGLILLIPIGIFFLLYYPYLMPKWNMHPSTAPHLRVMTYNVLFWNREYDSVAREILTYQPDFVALQEVQPAMMQSLRQRFASAYPYTVMGTLDPFGTTAVLSKHPILNQTILDLGVDRPAVIITTEINKQPVTFASAHLQAYNFGNDRPFRLSDVPPITTARTIEQNRQAAILRDHLTSLPGIIILGCDCNSHETSSSYRILNQLLHNAARDTALTLNPILAPNTRQDTNLQHIDYIFYDGPITPRSTMLIESTGGSDHFPLVADFYFITP